MRGLFLAACLLAAGCINVGVGGDPALRPVDRFHVLDGAEIGALQGKGPAAAKTDKTIAVRTFRARDRFDRNVIQRVGGADGALVQPLEFDLWADMPESAVTFAVREALGASGVFAAAVDPVDAIDAWYVLDGTILDYAWIDSPSSARFKARFMLSEAKSGKVLATSVHEATERLPGANTDGLGPAMGKAVGKALREALDRWTSAGVIR
jgi:hypothetical protein